MRLVKPTHQFVLCTILIEAIFPLAMSTHITPMVRPLRRVVSNFEVGRRASVMIVFQMQGDFDIRWFHNGPDYLDNSEFRDMLPVNEKADERFLVDTMVSYDVRAVTLTRINLPNEFPFTYRIIFTSTNETVSWQYQLVTKIIDPIPTRVDRLDSIRWLQAPAPVITYPPGGRIQLICAIKFQEHSVNDELFLYKTWSSNEPGANGLKDLILARINRGRGSFHEEYDNYLIEAGIANVHGGFKKFLLDFQVVENATGVNQAMYTCGVEREDVGDMSFVSTWVQMADPGEIISEPYSLHIIPCVSNASNGPTVTMRAGKANCVRCRAYGYPRAALSLTKNRVTPSGSGVHIDRHVDVPNGGLSEITLTFRDPQLRDSGTYVCSADNPAVPSLSRVDISFNITISGI